MSVAIHVVCHCPLYTPKFARLDQGRSSETSAPEYLHTQTTLQHVLVLVLHTLCHVEGTEPSGVGAVPRTGLTQRW
jgi:hypothetical protein